VPVERAPDQPDPTWPQAGQENVTTPSQAAIAARCVLKELVIHSALGEHRRPFAKLKMLTAQRP
jgi:hypothetical protein